MRLSIAPSDFTSKWPFVPQLRALQHEDATSEWLQPCQNARVPAEPVDTRWTILEGMGMRTRCGLPSRSTIVPGS